VFGFQDRPDYYGTGTLENTAGLWSYPVLSGTGTIQSRRAIEIGDISNTGGGTIDAQYGVRIKNLAAATTNYAIYSDGVTKSYHKGSIGINQLPDDTIKLFINGGAAAGEAGINVAKTDGYAVYTSGTGVSSFGGVLEGRARINAKTDLKVATNIGVKVEPIGATVFAGKVDNANPGSVFLATDSTGAALGNTADGFIKFVTDGSTRLELTNVSNSSTFRPGTDNLQYLGDATKRWKQLYSATGTINTSDDREKTYLTIDNKETLVAQELKTLIKKFKFNDAIESKGEDNARIHFGTSAQTVKAIFEKHGLVAEDYALLCYDEWEDEYEQVVDTEAILDEEGNVITEATYKDGELIKEAGNRYGIRYEELLCFIIGAI
jgi:hypothetical protein